MRVVTIILICLFAAIFGFPQSAKKSTNIDEFGILPCGDYLGHLDHIGNTVVENPSAQIFVLVYEGKTPQYAYKKDGTYSVRDVLPQYALAKTIIASMKQGLIQRQKRIPEFKIDRVVFVEAGFRESFRIETWVVPDGIKPPPKAPTVEKMKYRKGKPVGFCFED